MNGVIYSLAVKQVEILEVTFLEEYGISVRTSIYTLVLGLQYAKTMGNTNH